MEITVQLCPMAQFTRWFDDAVRSCQVTKNAMILATVSGAGKPSTRTVLLKEWNEEGGNCAFHFFTNKTSRKGKDLMACKWASGTIYWDTLERQICINGCVEELSRSMAVDVFKRRPRMHKLASWMFNQSAPIPGRAVLDRRFTEVAERFSCVSDEEIPCPPDWAGYRLIADEIEFWQSGLGRLHDRFLYTKNGSGWKITRLTP
jgi:pyridoxamine 5'-phosphate oxidase